MKIYCAGPLFCPGERFEMHDLSKAVESAGFDTFLPQRDGFEGAALHPLLVEKGWPDQQAQDMVNKVIFALDMYQLVDACDATIANLNGRVTDEGVIVEATVTAVTGKPLFLWKDDSRAPFSFGDNPMLTGLAGFRLYDNVEELIGALRECRPPDSLTALPERLQTTIALGASLASAQPEGLDAILAIITKFAE